MSFLEGKKGPKPAVFIWINRKLRTGKSFGKILIIVL
jgi:hypothetical protein